jgi:penicillin-binding protein 2
MRLRGSIKDTRRESALFRWRALAGFVLIMLSLLALLSRFAYLQIVRHDEFVTRAQNNRV